MRLQKFLAACGVASRRRAERMIDAGRVRVNGQPPRIGDSVDPEVDHVTVDVYEDRMPLRNLANITTPDATTILIVPYDKGTVKNIEKALSSQELGLNPSSDGNVVRINIPALTEDRRRDVLKVVQKVAEEGRVALRNIRRDANDSLKKLEKAKDLGKDEYHYFVDEVGKVLDEKVSELEELLSSKEKEIMED